ncbi:hypothetical protein SAMN05518849_11823 [Sphingobium sp. AP50]|nr:hypothetical protein SAMN05518849_11823 [Sphingobium sp. AP50]
MIGQARAILLVGGVACTLIAQAEPVHGQGKSRDVLGEERVIRQCIRRAASGRRWLDQTLWALRRKEGGWIGAEMRNSDGSVDLGPMQVNSWWVPRISRQIGRNETQVRSWLRHDACFNVDAARWIFLSALHEGKDFWRAIGMYHSPTRWRQMQYAKGIAMIMASDRRGRFGPQRQKY